MRIIGVLLILLGLTLFAAPRIRYTTNEKIIDTQSIEVTAKRQKAVGIPRIVGILTVGTGVLALFLAREKSNQ